MTRSRGGESLLERPEGWGSVLWSPCSQDYTRQGFADTELCKELSGRRVSSQGPTAGGRKPPLPASLSSEKGLMQLKWPRIHCVAAVDPELPILLPPAMGHPACVVLRIKTRAL